MVLKVTSGRVGVLWAMLWLTSLASASVPAREVAVDVAHTLAASGAVGARGGKEFDFTSAFPLA